MIPEWLREFRFPSLDTLVMFGIPAASKPSAVFSAVNAPLSSYAYQSRCSLMPFSAFDAVLPTGRTRSRTQCQGL